ncbi:MAG: NifB/NifX family molybdenum-iron cluster-binding protein [Candidatus Freyarchaeota archaeon]
MKICVTATAGELDAQVDPRFGRCPYFVIVDSETMRFEAIPNAAAGAMGGAGIQAAQIVVNKGINVLITGNVGPNAFQALSAAGIRIVTGAYGTVREVIEKYKRGELRETGGPTVPGHFGLGRRGMGMGRGWRRRW